MPGEKQRAQELEEAYEEAEGQEEMPSLSHEDTHTVGSLMKSFFNQLPEPLLTFSLYSEWITLQRQEECPGSESWCQQVQALMARMPQEHQQLLQALLLF